VFDVVFRGRKSGKFPLFFLVLSGISRSQNALGHRPQNGGQLALIVLRSGIDQSFIHQLLAFGLGVLLKPFLASTTSSG
jgi:hypothetical protein